MRKFSKIGAVCSLSSALVADVLTFSCFCNDRNAKNNDVTIDLHGLHADFAIEMLAARVASLQVPLQARNKITDHANAHTYKYTRTGTCTLTSTLK